MKNKVDRQLASGGVTDSTSFDLSHDDSAHIMTILRDTLYSDKILAVLREYGSNAWDAHRMAGKADLPIKVSLPSSAEPNLSIRDFGPGLSQEDVFNVYTKYGKSTKRETNSAVGMLGIGSKSGFAYADSFSITSWHAGEKSLYVAVLDESDKGTMNLMHREDCGPEETGVEVQIAVNQKDIVGFRTRAEVLFKHFEPQPEINTRLAPPPKDKEGLKNGIVFTDGGHYDDRGWTAVMGCVPYRLDVEQIRDCVPGIGESSFGLGGILRFDIGEVHINASREGLKYSEMTKKAIVEKINTTVDEFVAHMMKEIAKEEGGWNRRLAASALRQLKLPLVDKYLKQNKVYIHVGESSPEFFFVSDAATRKVVVTIPVDQRTRLFIHDSPRAMSGYDLGAFARVIRRRGKATQEEAEEELTKYLGLLDIEGIPVKRLSEARWEKSYVEAKGNPVAAAKHNRNVFQLVERPSFIHPLSNDWSPIKREPTEDDVFVILHRFESTTPLSSNVLEVKAVCKHFKVDFPSVYGYKDTESKPAKAEDLSGKSYEDWRAGLYKKLCETPEAKELLEGNFWLHSGRGCLPWGVRTQGKAFDEPFQALLGEDHPLVAWFNQARAAKFSWDKLNHLVRATIAPSLSNMAVKEDCEPYRRLESMKKAYPLLFIHGLGELWQDDSNHWIDYIKMVDEKNTLTSESEKKHEQQDSVHSDERVHQRDLGGEAEHDSQERAELCAIA